MNLFILKETVLIFASEVYHESLSKLLDKKQDGARESTSIVVGFVPEIGPSERASDIIFKKEGKANRLCYQEMPEDKRLPWVRWAFGSVVAVACIPQKALILIWGLSTSVCCPLIVAVMPGFFYYRVVKQKEEEKTILRKCGLTYAAIGMLAIPLFVTLTTKHIFMVTLPS